MSLHVRHFFLSFRDIERYFYRVAGLCVAIAGLEAITRCASREGKITRNSRSVRRYYRES